MFSFILYKPDNEIRYGHYNIYLNLRIYLLKKNRGKKDTNTFGGKLKSKKKKSISSLKHC